MAQVVGARGDMSLYVYQKWKDTNLGNCVAPVLAFVNEYPITTLFFGVCIALSALPLVLFTSFVIYSLFFTIFSFAMVEGTLLLIAFSLLFCVIFFVVCMAICATALLILTWCTAAAWYSLAQRFRAVIQFFFPSFVTSLEKCCPLEQNKTDKTD